MRKCPPTIVIIACSIIGKVLAGEPLPLYQPKVKHAPIYFYHPGAQPALQYNHDVDIVKFKGKFFAAWNANESAGEDKPGQYNFLSVSDDFENWSPPVRLFGRNAGAENPVESDNQWQPTFINWRDETLFCAWCDYNARKTCIAASADGLRWRNREMPMAPPSLTGKVVGFPTNHGLLTSQGVMMFPCSLPPIEDKCRPTHTRYAAVLLSGDGGQTWTWSEPIEALPWSQLGDKPEEVRDELVPIWEPMLFEQGDGRIGLLVRNNTGPGTPHRMLLCATSSDHGRTWTKARSVEVDTLMSRNFTVSGVGTRDSLLMAMNDNHPDRPSTRPQDRYFLSLFVAPVCDPDLFLPGPVLQPEGGRAYYPNGFVDRGKLYVGYTYPRGIHGSVMEPLPDFTRPFLLPRGARTGLLTPAPPMSEGDQREPEKTGLPVVGRRPLAAQRSMEIENGIACFAQRHACLGLVLTAKLTHQPKLRLAFDVNVRSYDGAEWPLLTLGGKTRAGTTLRAVYSEPKATDVFQVALGADQWADIAPFKMAAWNHIEVEMIETGFSVSVNRSSPQSFPLPLLRKICFGGLYARPDWPVGRQPNSDVRLKLDSIVVE